MMLDHDEKRIHRAFENFSCEIDTQNLEKKVFANMNKSKLPVWRKRTGSLIAASIALMMLVGGSVYAAAGLGIIELGIFSRFVDPIEMYVIDQGIRVDVIGAQQFGNIGLVYLSVQDVSGQNRLAEDSLIFPILSSTESESMGTSRMITSHLIHFDTVLNKLYFQLEFQQDVSMSRTLTLMIDSVWLENTIIDTPLPISLSGIGEAATVPLPADNTRRGFESVLIPQGRGNFSVSPSDGEWISNIAITNGHLHIQIGREAASPWSNLYLVAPNGETALSAGSARFRVDENLEILCPSTLAGRIWLEGEHVPYFFRDQLFWVDIDALDDYSFVLREYLASTIDGDWSMTIHLEESVNAIHQWEGALSLDATILESVTVSPFGVYFSGSVPDMNTWRDSSQPLKLSLETTTGIVALQESPVMPFLVTGGGVSLQDSTGARPPAMFNGFVKAMSPIHVDEVTAFIVNGVRVPLE
jgi:hypothetical protein